MSSDRVSEVMVTVSRKVGQPNFGSHGVSVTWKVVRESGTLSYEEAEDLTLLVERRIESNIAVYEAAAKLASIKDTPRKLQAILEAESILSGAKSTDERFEKLYAGILRAKEER